MPSDFDNLTVSLPVGATEVSLMVANDSVPEARKSGGLVLDTVSTGVEIIESSSVVAVELRDDDPDVSALTIYAPAYPSGPSNVHIGQPIDLIILGGLPPYRYEVNGAVIVEGNLSRGVIDYNGDGLIDLGQKVTMVPTALGAASLKVLDAGEGSQQLDVTVDVVGIGELPLPSIPLSVGDETNYISLALSSLQGVERALEFATNNPTTVIKIGAWDASQQQFVTLPQTPSGGLLPTQGIFFAARNEVSLDLSGYAVFPPYRILLQPGWNFIGIPVMNDLESVEFSDLVVRDELDIVASGVDAEALIGSAAYQWNGTDYQLTSTLLAGKAYWIFNAATDPEQTLSIEIDSPETGDIIARTTGTDHGQESVYRVSDAERQPPFPGSGSIAGSSSGSSSSGGCGSGFWYDGSIPSINGISSVVGYPPSSAPR